MYTYICICICICMYMCVYIYTHTQLITKYIPGPRGHRPAREGGAQHARPQRTAPGSEIDSLRSSSSSSSSISISISSSISISISISIVEYVY